MERADALAIITEWDEFRALDLKRVRVLLNIPTIIDFRNIYTLEEMRSAQLTYISVGRETVLGRSRRPRDIAKVKARSLMASDTA
jgi:UDPglucose 6-dehydrogenase